MDIASIPLPLVAAAGAVVAALLTGMFSFVNLVLSKDLKISDARLNWNDALREDISALLAHVETLTRLAEHQLEGYKAGDPAHPEGFLPAELAKFRADNKEEYLALNEARHRVGLRLNPVEHQSLARAIDELVDAFRGDCANVTPVFSIANRVVTESQIVLRSTWHKVREGEANYVSTKRWLKVGGLLGIAAVVGTLSLATVVSLRGGPTTASSSGLAPAASAVKK